MLIGTSCRFSARLRAVTMTSSRVVSADASVARAGRAWKVAAPDNTAATAMASLEGENVGGSSRRNMVAAERAGDLRLISHPLVVRLQHALERMPTMTIMSRGGILCQSR